ncbi:YbaB/EbfC family nucleoid-associated protein [Actinosynnema sp. CS-041913]|uniref:YbaB/EbfC family nucleoid-associated protein n=1 Tax=Actinosynnema sp. CS-041913 TaxID=3239917 RepID=UPI003D9386AA
MNDFGGLADTYDRLLAGIEATRDGTADLRVSADSPDGLITATVTARGELADLRIDPRVYHAPDSAALSDAILDATRRATLDAHRQVFTRLRALLPADATFEDTDVELGPFLHQLGQALRDTPRR